MTPDHVPPVASPASGRDFCMPSLGTDMTGGKVVRWLVPEGGVVAAGDLLAEVETEKGVFDVESEAGGVVEAYLVPLGTRVPVGTPLARMRDGAAAEAAPATTHAPAAPTASRDAPALPDRATATPPADAHATAVPAGAPEPGEAAPDAMRHAIARAVARSAREIPHYYLASDIDLSAALAWLEVTNRARAIEQRILPAALLLRATVRALMDFPQLNGTWEDDAFRPAPAVHLGVALPRRDHGLLTPAMLDAERLDLPGVMAALADLVRRTREGGLRGREMREATVTVSNLGEEGVPLMFGIIYPPQVALVGFGRVVERAWAAGRLIGVRPVVTATLAADHRITDGRYGARFLARLDRLLQHPEGL